LVGHKDLRSEIRAKCEELEEKVKELEEGLKELKEYAEKCVLREEYEKLERFKVEELMESPRFKELLRTTVSNVVHEEIEGLLNEEVRDVCRKILEGLSKEVQERLREGLEEIVVAVLTNIAIRLKEELVDFLYSDLSRGERGKG